MSIKYFHLIFITASWLLCLLLAAYCFFMPDNQGRWDAFLGGIALVAAALVLMAYEWFAWKKLKKIYI